MNRVSAIWLAFLLPAALSGVQAANRESSEPVVFPLASFRVTFGVNDSEPTIWNGEWTPQDGQTVTVEPDYFFAEPTRDLFRREVERQSEQAFDTMRSATSWTCMTRVGPSGLAADEWINRSEQEPQPIMQRPSVLVHVWRGIDTGVRLKTEQGAFEFRPPEIELGRSE